MRIQSDDVRALTIRCSACQPDLNKVDPDSQIRVAHLTFQTFRHGIRYKRSDGTKVEGTRYINAFIGQCDCGQIWIVLLPE
jgi:hypothetical protein